MHGKFAAAKVSTFVVSDFGVVWDFDCQGLCITPLDDEGFVVIEDLRYSPYRATFDFECYFSDDDYHPTATNFNGRHVTYR